MKKILRVLICTVTVLCLVLSLSGCQMLDTMKATHAVWNENGNIVLGNTEYLALPPCDELQPEYSFERNDIYVTDSDVPVLLSQFLGQDFSHSDDGVFLSNYYDYTESVTYCRKDRYDEIINHIQNGIEYDKLCYYYSYYDDERGDWEDKYYILSENEASAVKTVYTTVSPTQLPAGAELTAIEYSAHLMFCLDDLPFKKDFCELAVVSDTYYLIEYPDEGSVVYQVPKELNSTFKSIMSALIKSENQWLDY
ncbi:MAG: hypothetical protein IKD04_05950 [Clostridia bacterium]|nr:hypothetical protein [Clostridia bacterium]